MSTTGNPNERYQRSRYEWKDYRTYPSDFPFPSCLILGYNSDMIPIHIVLSEEGHASRIITSYIPNLEHWEVDYERRKGQ